MLSLTIILSNQLKNHIIHFACCNFLGVPGVIIFSGGFKELYQYLINGHFSGTIMEDKGIVILSSKNQDAVVVSASDKFY